MEDNALLRQYVSDGNDEAFATLVTRHINLVYSVALRCAGNPESAEEITQAVFIILAKKAMQLRHDKALSSWLFQTTRLTAANFVRSESRRRYREQEAHMQSVLNEPEDDLWPKLAPLLDSAVADLRDKDRQAILLRFYEGKNLREVGVALGTSEDAAEKRVSRALEKLRKSFAKRGVSSTAPIIAGTISLHSVQAAPAALVKSVAVVAATKGAAAGGSILFLVTKTMKTMTWLKIKFAVGVGVAALVAVGVATVSVSQTSNAGDGLTPQQIANQSQDVYAALTSYNDTGKVVTSGGGQPTETTFNIRLKRPNFLRVEWTQTGGFYTSKGLVWSDGKANYFIMGAADQFESEKPQKVSDLQMALGMATGVSSSAASDIPGTFFDQNWGDQLKVWSSPLAHTQKFADEKIGDTDCYVIERSLDPMPLPHNQGTTGKSTTRLWIGKRDHLIHQIQTTSEGASVNMNFTDEAVKTQLERQGKPVTPEAMAEMRATLEKDTQAAKGKKFVFLQTHENISVNQELADTNFQR